MAPGPVHRRRRRPVPAGVAAFLTAAALLVGGCDNSETTPEEEASGTVVVFLDACARDRPLAVLDTLTEPLQRAFLAAARAPSAAAGCELIAPGLTPGGERGLGHDAGFGIAGIDDVVVDGGFAAVTVSSPLGRADLDLEQVAGDWKIATQPPS